LKKFLTMGIGISLLVVGAIAVATGINGFFLFTNYRKDATSTQTKVGMDFNVGLTLVLAFIVIILILYILSLIARARIAAATSE
jgi:heme/copper-type cytochrome/quinol oxidase subunit 2